MKKVKIIANIIINILPFLAWIVWFLCAFYDVETSLDLFVIELLLLMLLPIIYTIYNLILSKDNKTFLIQNSVFLLSQVIGVIMSGMLYYNYISDDSGTALVVTTFAFISIIYTVLVSVAFWGVKLLIKKLLKKNWCVCAN